MFLAALAALALATSAPPSFAQKVDKNGRCHDASGKFAKDEVCKGVGGVGGAVASTKSAVTGAGEAVGRTANGAAKSAENAAGGAAKSAENAVDPKAPYKLDTKGKCHDAKGKMASKSKCA
jgi:hypothetical protein